jgi:tetratricopeptide (TPR) repeat protein
VTEPRRPSPPASPNVALLAVLADQALTQHELADLVNTAIEALFGEPGNCTDTHVRRWTSGSVRWPHPRYLLAFEHALGRSALDLGFLPRGRASVEHLTRVRSTILLTQEPDPMRRREFLSIAVGTALTLDGSGSAGALPPRLRGRIGMSDVARLQSDLGKLHAVDGRYGGGDLVKAASATYAAINQAMTTCTYGEQVGRALYSTAGEFAASAGWFAFDSGDQATASRNYDQALRLALLAGDSILQAHALIAMALQALQLGRAPECVAIARAALEQKAARQTQIIAAVFHAREGIGFSRSGEASLAARSFKRAQRSLDRHTDPSQVPVWLAFFGSGEMSGLLAQAQLAVGDYTGAEEAAKDAVKIIGPRYARNRFIHTVTQAHAQLGRKHVEEACATADGALDAARHLRSERGVNGLQDFCRTLVPYSPTVPAAQDFLDRSRQLLPALAV